MGYIQRLRERWGAAALAFNIATGRKVWGRQPSRDGMGATTRAKATMTAKIIRADGTIEDLGVVSKRTVELTQAQMQALEQAAREQ